MKNFWKYAAAAPFVALAAVSCGDDDTASYPDKGWGELTAPQLTVSAEETVLDKAAADDEALRFEWTAAADDKTAVEYDLYINIDGGDIFAGVKHEAAGTRSASFTAAELNDMLAAKFGARSGERVELRACVHARANDMLIEDKTSNEVPFAVTAYEAEIVLPEALYMKGGACPDGWDKAVELRKDGDAVYTASGVELRFGKPADNKGFKFYVEPDGSYPFYGQALGGEFGDMAVFASENDGDSQFYPLQHGYTSGVYTVTADLGAMRLTLDRTGDVYEFDPDAVLYILGDGMEHGWDMVEQNALAATGDNTFEIAEIALKADSKFKFYFHDWTEFIRDEAAADYWTLKRKGDGDGDIRFIPSEAGLGAGTYKVSVDLSAQRVQLTLVGAEPEYPAQLFIFGPATEAGWDLGSFIPMTASGSGVYRAEGVRIDVGTANPDDIKGNGFKFGVSNTDWGTEYGAAGSFDNGYRGWEIVQGKDQFYPLLMGLESGTYDITADLAAGVVRLEPAQGGGDNYPAALYIIGDAMPHGWDLGNAVAMTRTAPGVFTAENVAVNVGAVQDGNPKGNGFKFIISNTDWLTEYGAAGSFDEGYLGWEMVQGSNQFYPLMMGFASGSYRIMADIAAGKVTFEKM